MRKIVVLGLLSILAAAPSQAADTVPSHLEAARAAHARGDFARASQEAEAVVAELHARLGKSLGEFLPPAQAGWQSDPVEVQGLASTGGGLSVSRGYSRDEASLNVSLILDSPAVASTAVQIAASVADPTHFKRFKLGQDDALLRWDGANRSGDVVLVLGGRVLLQIEGENLASADLLTEAAKGWNLAGIRKYLGL